jgi:hypothetical protein
VPFSGKLSFSLLYSDSYIAGNRRENVRPMAETVAFALLGAFLAFAYLYSDDEFGFIEKRSLKPSFSDRMMKN